MTCRDSFIITTPGSSEPKGARTGATSGDSGLSPDWRNDATGIPGGDEQVAVQEGQPSVESTSDRELPRTSVPVGRPGMLTGVDGAPSALGTAGPQGVVLRTVCSWCEREGVETIIVDGPRDAEGRSSHGICKEHADREIARIREANAHNLPLYITRREPAGTYRVEDRQGRMLARSLPGSGIASAMAVRLEEITKSGESWCPKHVPTPLLLGRCVSCHLGWELSTWAVGQ